MRKKREEKFVTIKDVAKEADVSIATVSRVINNGNVKAPKKRKVLEAIKKLNYVPNASARNLASVSETKRIILLIPDISQIYYSDMIKGFKDTLRTYNYDPIIDSYNFDDELYESINQKYQLSSEFKAVVQVGKNLDVTNKMIISLNDENIEYELSNKLVGGAIYTNDKYIRKFIEDNLLDEVEAYNQEKEYNVFLAPTLQEALELYNKGIKDKDIYTFAPVNEISKICKNIKRLDLDFYFLGVLLARIATKRLRGEEITPIVIKIN